MQLGVTLPQPEVAKPATFAARAEELGYESIWQNELWGSNAVAQLGAAATATDDVKVGTAVLNVFSRTPAVIAMAAASLQDISRRQALLGIGVSTPSIVGDLHGMAFERPLVRTKETVELLQRLFSTEDSVTYRGEEVEVTDVSGLDVDVPIYNAALGPQNRRLTGEFCDGWLPVNLPLSRLDERFEAVAAGAREAGRDPSEITVSPGIHVVASEAPTRARNAIRETIAYYIGASEGYRNAMRAEFPDAVPTVAAALDEGDRSTAAGRVTDEMVDELGCAGHPDDVRDRLRSAVQDTLVDRLIVTVPPGLDEDLVHGTVEAAAPCSL